MKKSFLCYVNRYIDFLSENKTERECNEFFIKQAEKEGYKNIESTEEVYPGDKVYISKMGKAVGFFYLGKKPIQEGMNIVCAHIDSPRLDIKCRPFYLKDGNVYLDTHYYGGIRKYQWVTTPLAIHGVVCKKDGTKVSVCIGEKETEPVFCISDLLPHLAQDQKTKPAESFITGEELDVIIGSYTEKEEEDAKKRILDILERYGIEEDDFLSAELEVVPAGKARYLGIDSSMIIGYGHDDRSCAFAAMEAMVSIEEPEKTSLCLFVDKEEIGSVGATGFDSVLLENMVSEIVYKTKLGKELSSNREYIIRKALENSNLLSSDVNAAYDPMHADVFDKNNASMLGKGPAFCKFTGARGKSGANDANPEYIAKIRKILDKDNVPFQFCELGKVDKGGGGTIALFAAKYGMNVIDIGVPVLSMHAPWEVVSTEDIFQTERAYEAFLNSNFNVK